MESHPRQPGDCERYLAGANTASWCLSPKRPQPIGASMPSPPINFFRRLRKRPSRRTFLGVAAFLLLYIVCWKYTIDYQPNTLPSPFAWGVVRTRIPAPFVIINDEAELAHGTGAERRVYLLIPGGSKHLVYSSPIEFPNGMFFGGPTFSLEHQVIKMRQYRAANDADADDKPKGQITK